MLQGGSATANGAVRGPNACRTGARDPLGDAVVFGFAVGLRRQVEFGGARAVERNRRVGPLRAIEVDEQHAVSGRAGHRVRANRAGRTGAGLPVHAHRKHRRPGTANARTIASARAAGYGVPEGGKRPTCGHVPGHVSVWAPAEKSDHDPNGSEP